MLFYFFCLFCCLSITKIKDLVIVSNEKNERIVYFSVTAFFYAFTNAGTRET
jgi:hypothetical protein